MQYDKYFPLFLIFCCYCTPLKACNENEKYEKLGKCLSFCTQHCLITSTYVITDIYNIYIYTLGRRNFINMRGYGEFSYNIREQYDVRVSHKRNENKKQRHPIQYVRMSCKSSKQCHTKHEYTYTQVCNKGSTTHTNKNESQKEFAGCA